MSKSTIYQVNTKNVHVKNIKTTCIVLPLGPPTYPYFLSQNDKGKVTQKIRTHHDQHPGDYREHEC